MSDKSSGCGCGAIALLWFVVFAFVRVCGFTDVSWWYSMAPLWWPVWMLFRFVGWLITVVVLVVMILCGAAAVKFLTGGSQPKKGDVIDVECDVIDVEYEEEE
jgi:hypothetical protein